MLNESVSPARWANHTCGADQEVGSALLAAASAVGAVVSLRLTPRGPAAGVTTREVVDATEDDGLRTLALALRLS